MDKWRSIHLSKEEEEGVVVEDDEICEVESFQRTLAGKLWTDISFNVRAFKSTMISAWKLKNQVESQDLGKNMFLFKFATKRDLEFVLKNGPWSFDRSLLVLNRISGEEEPSDLNMHFASFWVRIYELPLNLRTEAMARKIGNILGNFEEMDAREATERETLVKVKDKNLRVHFKYERLPTFCFVCGRLGHQMKDCESLDDLTEEVFEELEEQDLSYGQWLRASPLPKMNEDQKKGDSSSGTCSKNLFQVSSRQSRCNQKVTNKSDEAEVEQDREATEERGEARGGDGNPEKSKHKEVDIEKMAESLGAVALSLEGIGDGIQKRTLCCQKRNGLGGRTLTLEIVLKGGRNWWKIARGN
ncbi:uncharacterized protein LOC131628740 [Vicia villosa]|uniref:uncharacterized protein LOC131628740 n=1 Tax=Vicia villosa TaxID=3911 RepID=UPI00273CA362|nr:uncharacterized protein LOC131628740 [Vicia villosa]